MELHTEDQKLAEFCQVASLGRKLPSEKSGKCCELGTKPASLFFVADCYGRTMATIFDDDTSDNDVVNIEEEEEEDEEEEELSRECLRLRCLPEPSFADMSYVAATCRRHVFAHVADTATLHVG